MSIFTRVFILVFCLFFSFGFAGPNQTDTLSPILPPDSLPFDITIEQASFSLPSGIHSGAYAVYKGKWVFIAGRTNGLHGFGPGIGNFPPSRQNTTVYVVDPANQKVFSRSLDDASSGLTQQQIDQLSVTSPQSFYTGKTLYISGGYGVDTERGNFSTKPVLTAIDIPGLIKWVVKSPSGDSAARHIRQTYHEFLRVTGGYMTAVDPHLSALLIFGQNFQGLYNPNSNGNYTEQVRCFQIIDNGDDLYVQPRKSKKPNPNYRRRDLNVVPVIKNNTQEFVALSGVFTLDTGIWTVPVVIKPNGSSKMADPSDSSTFKQGMNNYVSSNVGLYSNSSKKMFIVLMGGISYGYFENGQFEVDAEFPFINQITTVQIDKKGRFSQYLMNNQFPVILSTGSNPGNQLLFGAAATFIPSSEISLYSNRVIRLDKIKKPTVIGYIVGGIMSTLSNTNTEADSTASPYIFKVILTPKYL